MSPPLRPIDVHLVFAGMSSGEELIRISRSIAATMDVLICRRVDDESVVVRFAGAADRTIELAALFPPSATFNMRF
jgi:hypothetical protein